MGKVWEAPQGSGGQEWQDLPPQLPRLQSLKQEWPSPRAVLPTPPLRLWAHGTSLFLPGRRRRAGSPWSPAPALCAPFPEATCGLQVCSRLRHPQATPALGAPRPWQGLPQAHPRGLQSPRQACLGTQEGVCAAGLEFERWLNATGPPLAEPDLSQGSSLTRPVEALFQLWTAEPLDQAAASASAIDISKWRTFQTALFLDRLLDGSPLPQGESRSCQGGRGGGGHRP